MSVSKKLFKTILTIFISISLVACGISDNAADAVRSEAVDFATTANYDSTDLSKQETVEQYYFVLAMVMDAETVFLEFDNTTYEDSEEISIDDQYELARKAKEVTANAADEVSKVSFTETEGQTLVDSAVDYLNKLSENCELAMDYMEEEESDITAYNNSYELLVDYQSMYYLNLDDYLYYNLNEDEYAEIYYASDENYFAIRSNN